MNPLLYKSQGVFKSTSLLALDQWQELEKANPTNCAVDQNGVGGGLQRAAPGPQPAQGPTLSAQGISPACLQDLLDNLTLELRVHPPEINIDNGIDEKSTVVTIDSANRPGSLIYVSAHAYPFFLLPTQCCHCH